MGIGQIWKPLPRWLVNHGLKSRRARVAGVMMAMSEVFLLIQPAWCVPRLKSRHCQSVEDISRTVAG